MSIESEMKEQGMAPSSGRENGLAESLIRVNSLDYELPSNMSVVVSRNLKRSFANLDQYKENGKVIITLNTGTDYCDGINSYLTFKARVSGPAGSTAGFGSGSACNFIENITITSRSGVEIERIEGLNNLRREHDRYDCSQDWIDNFGSVMGYTNEAKTNAPVLAQDADLQFCIPMGRLAGSFNTRKLIPSQLAGGLRIEIKLASLGSALIKGATAPTGYQLTDVTMMCDCYQLADSIQKRLNMNAAANGLEFYFETYDRTKFNESASNQANITVRKAVSRALWAIAKSRLSANVDNLAVDSIASEPNKVKDFFWRLGSLYFPNQPLRNKEEMYYFAQYCFDKVKKCHNQNSVSLKDFKGDEGIVAVTLERSNVLGLSGLPINNARTLQLDMNFDTSASRDVDIYMAYIKLVRVFINNCVVKE